MELSAKEIKTLNELKDKSTKEFIADLTFLVTALHSKNTKDDDFIFIKDAYNVAKSENPDVVVMVSGPYIWKYREQIEKSDINFILNNDYTEEVEAAKTALVENQKYDQIKDILKKIKSTWSAFNPVEQSTIIKKIQKLVVSYAGYLGATKKLNGKN